jgi:transposase
VSNEIENYCLCQRPSQLIYDDELWQRIKQKKGRGRQLAERFKVSLLFIRDLTRRYRETGKVEPKPYGGGAVAKLGVAKLPVVQALVEALVRCTA